MKSYYPKINGLRCIAICLVLLQHFAKLIAEHIYAGYYGVDLFFVISGFVVTSVLLRPAEKSFTKNYTNFLGRRVLRIFPIYYLTILIFWLSGHPIVRENLPYLVTYSFNYALVYKSLPKSAIGPFWSLCVEEQFYLLWPIVVLLLKNKTRVLLMVTLAIIMIGYSQQVWSVFPSLAPYNYVSLFTRMAPLGLGALAAIAANNNTLPGKIFTNAWFEYFMLMLLVTTLVTSFTFKLPVLGLCSFYLIIKAAFYDFALQPFSRFLANKKVIYIGTISYGIYVFHLPVVYFFTNYVMDPIWSKINFDSLGRFEKLRWNIWIVKLPLYSFVSIALASLSYKYIETPILKLKDRFFKY